MRRRQFIVNLLNSEEKGLLKPRSRLCTFNIHPTCNVVLVVNRTFLIVCSMAEGTERRRRKRRFLTSQSTSIKQCGSSLVAAEKVTSIMTGLVHAACLYAHTHARTHGLH